MNFACAQRKKKEKKTDERAPCGQHRSRHVIHPLAGEVCAHCGDGRTLLHDISFLAARSGPRCKSRTSLTGTDQLCLGEKMSLLQPVFCCTKIAPAVGLFDVMSLESLG